MKTIPLTLGYFTKVDDEDYEKFAKKRWFAYVNQNYKHIVRAIRSEYRDGKRTTIVLAREIMGNPKGMMVDHKNGDTLDNRKSNLRICNRAENGSNRGKQINNKSGYKGVYWYKYTKKWKAQIKVKGKVMALGYYFNKVDAAKAYNQASLEFHGEFANINIFRKLKG